MREVGLINVASPNVVDDPPHAVAVAFARHRRGDLRHRRLAKRRLGGGRLAKRAELSEPKRGGCFGYFGYELKQFVEPHLPLTTHNDLELPECSVGFYDSLVVFDHKIDKAWLISTGLGEEGDRSDERAQAAAAFWLGQLGTLGQA
ncbi:MAG: hypothetical protein HOF61_09920, partial [Verrucomicrobia bacterium]|nr:hypothetical protein [Verrucomicrobiota bacterium]